MFPMYASAKTVEVVYSADIKFGNLTTYTDWQTFSLID